MLNSDLKRYVKNYDNPVERFTCLNISNRLVIMFSVKICSKKSVQC